MSSLPPPAPEALYSDLAWPDPPPGRPYVAANMVSTVDGKALPAAPPSTARGLGSRTDQKLMRRLESAVDAVVVGAGTVRASAVIYNPRLFRVVVTRTGDVDTANPFFTDAPHRAVTCVPPGLAPGARQRLEAASTVVAAQEPADVLAVLRHDFGVQSALVEGGPSLLYAFLEAGCIDEMFLTLAPMLKGGAAIPTVLEGDGLPDRQVLGLDLLSAYAEAGEIYLRYRVGARREV